MRNTTFTCRVDGTALIAWIHGLPRITVYVEKEATTINVTITSLPSLFMGSEIYPFGVTIWSSNPIGVYRTWKDLHSSSQALWIGRDTLPRHHSPNLSTLSLLWNYLFGMQPPRHHHVVESLLLFLLLFICTTTLFGIIYGSHYTISASFCLYLQYFQHKIFNFS